MAKWEDEAAWRASFAAWSLEMAGVGNWQSRMDDWTRKELSGDSIVAIEAFAETVPAHWRRLPAILGWRDSPGLGNPRCHRDRFDNAAVVALDNSLKAIEERTGIAGLARPAVTMWIYRDRGESVPVAELDLLGFNWPQTPDSEHAPGLAVIGSCKRGPSAHRVDAHLAEPLRRLQAARKGLSPVVDDGLNLPVEGLLISPSFSDEDRGALQQPGHRSLVSCGGQQHLGQRRRTARDARCRRSPRSKLWGTRCAILQSHWLGSTRLWSVWLRQGNRARNVQEIESGSGIVIVARCGCFATSMTERSIDNACQEEIQKGITAMTTKKAWLG